MAEFLKEWGPAIITAIAVLIMIFIVRSFKTTMQTNMNTIMRNFQTTTTDEFNLTKAK